MNPACLSWLRYSLALRPSSLSPFRAFSTTSNLGTSTSAARDTQTVTLPDGRVLSYAEYGPKTGYPIFYFHGYPSSRLEAGPISQLAAARRGLRLIAPDRPGFGLSTFQPGRKITSWPADISFLASHLGLARFAVLGGSGGGPYALACAQALPHTQMSAVGVLAGAPPWEAGTKEVLWYSRLAAVAANYAPGALTVVVDAAVRGVRWVVEIEWVRLRLERWLEAVEKEEQRRKKKGGLTEERERERSTEKDEKQSLKTESRCDRLLPLLFEPFAQGASASVQEAKLLTQDWGFRFEDVKYERIQIWHGTRDVNAPVSMIRWMAARLPHCELRESDHTHFTLVDQLEEILAQLVPDETAKE